MKALMYVVGIGIVFLCVPYIRFVFKRFLILSKIKKACLEKEYHLQGTSPFWFLGSRNGKNCDCYIETPEERFAVKLFGVPRRRRVLVFTEKREYFTRILVGMLLLIKEAFDSKANHLPEYDFVYANKAVSDNKKLRKILLINPVPMEMLWQAERGKEIKPSPFPVENMREENGKERILSPGDEIYGMEIANLSWLLKQLN